MNECCHENQETEDADRGSWGKLEAVSAWNANTFPGFQNVTGHAEEMGTFSGIIGSGVDALSTLDPMLQKENTVTVMTVFLGFVGGTAGAVLELDMNNIDNPEQYGAISRVYPVIELSPERNVFGVGIVF